MSYSGLNLASSANQNPDPYFRPAEATAYTQNLQQSLAIVKDKDSADVSFTELYKPQQQYNSNATRPLLPPAHTMRATTAETGTEDTSKQQEMREKITKMLPDNIQQALLVNQQLPREQQFADFIALDKVLDTLSKALVIVESGGEPLLRNSPAQIHQELNQQLPAYVRSNFENTSYEVLSAIKDKLNQIGPNNPDFDALHYYATLSSEGLDGVKNRTQAA